MVSRYCPTFAGAGQSSLLTDAGLPITERVVEMTVAATRRA
jgi:hypothetical protein